MVSQSAMTGIHSVCYQHSEEGTPELDQSWEWEGSDCNGAREAFSTRNVAHWVLKDSQRLPGQRTAYALAGCKMQAKAQ